MWDTERRYLILFLNRKAPAKLKIPSLALYYMDVPVASVFGVCLWRTGTVCKAEHFTMSLELLSDCCGRKWYAHNCVWSLALNGEWRFFLFLSFINRKAWRAGWAPGSGFGRWRGWDDAGGMNGELGEGWLVGSGLSTLVYDRFLLPSKFLKLEGLIFISANSMECSWPFQWNQFTPWR